MIQISVIIPSYNRPDSLVVCLQALTLQNLSRDRFEVIVVNDGGCFDAEGLREQFGQRLNLVLLEQENQGPASARNHGLASARGRFVAFTDDDCAPDPHWLEAFLASLEHGQGHLCGGHTVNALKDNIYSSTSQLLVDYNYRYFNTDMGPDSYFTSNNMAMSRDRLQEIKGFDESYPGACGEDRDLCDRWQDAGWALNYAPGAVVNHRHELSLYRMVRQHWNYGSGSWYYHQFRKARKKAELRIEPFAYYKGMFKFAWQVNENKTIYSIFLVGVCQLANAAGYSLKKLKALFE